MLKLWLIALFVAAKGLAVGSVSECATILRQTQTWALATQRFPSDLVERADEVQKLRYFAPPSGMSAKKRAENILGFSLGEPIANGGFREVFLHPKDPTKVIKVIDPILQPGLEESFLTVLLQRDIALYRVIRDRGMEVARIENTPHLWERGIFIQDKIEGALVSHALRDDKLSRRDRRRMIELVESLEKLDKEARLFFYQRFSGFELLNSGDQGPIPRLGIAVDAESNSVGIDLGSHFSNVILRNGDRVPVMIDW